MKSKRTWFWSYRNYVNCMYCFSCRNDGWWQKETYYGVMKNETTIDKMISEKDEKLKRMLNFLQMQKYLLKRRFRYDY